MAECPPFAWLEISLTVDGEMAEAAAEVLARFAPNGVVIESTNVEFPPNSDFDTDAIGIPSGPLRVYAYLPIAYTTDALDEVNDEDLISEAATQAKLQEVEKALWHLGFIRPLAPSQYKIVRETDWASTWKQHYHPIPVGKQLIIVPAWMDVPLEGRIPLRIDPGMAFGTGTHPTTQLCLSLLEEAISALASAHANTCVDIGCGSGILSIAALKLGIGHALGVDTDANVIPIAYDNAQLNDAAEQLTLGVGSLQEILDGMFGVWKTEIVIANILAPVIIRLLDEGMANLLTPTGILILSGILDEQLDAPHQGVFGALTRNGLHVVEKRQIEDWVALVAKPS